MTNWIETTVTPKNFEKIVFVYNGEILFGTFKDFHMGKNYEDYTEWCEVAEIEPTMSYDMYNFHRYYIDRVDVYGNVDWDDVSYWMRIPELPKGA